MLTDDNIKSLHKWTKVQGVEYYDVQLEIVDHLATSIESQMIENSEQSFQEIFDQEVLNWPQDKIEKLIKEKNHQLYWGWMSKIFRLTTDYFTFPKVIIWIALSAVIYFVIQSFGDFNIVSDTFYKVYLYMFLGHCFARMFYVDKIPFLSKPSLLTIKSFRNTIGFLFLAPYSLIIYINSTSSDFIAEHLSFVQSAIMALMLLMLHAMIFTMPKLLKVETIQYYKHLDKVIK